MSQQKQIKANKQNRLNEILAGKTSLLSFKTGLVDVELKKQIDWFLNTYYPMPEWEKQELRAKWDKYYEQCADSVEAHLMTEMRKAMKEGNGEKFGELLKQARQMIKNGIVEIPKPSGYDPQIWDNSQWANDYRILKHELKDADAEAFASVTGGSW